MTRARLRALAGASIAGLALAAAAALPAAAADATRLTSTGRAEFPGRSFLLSLPAGSPTDPGAVTVLENGQPVEGISVSVPGASGDRVGIVLAIDASRRMQGAAIEQAMAAARAFADTRADGARLAVVAFGSAATVLLPLTRDPARITAALRRAPALSREARLYDGLDRSLQLLRQAGIQLGSVVLLSGGADAGSTAQRQQVVAAAQRSHTRIFTVGLRSPQLDESSLGRLGAATRGTFAAADAPSDLRAILGDLGAVLAHEFLIEYRSLAEPAQTVFVTARAGDATAGVAEYTSPGSAGDGGSRSWWDRLVQSDVLAALVSIVVVALVFCSVFLVARGRDRRFRHRVLQYTAEGLEQRAAERRANVNEELQQRRPAIVRTRVVTRFLEDAELAGIQQPPATLLLYVAAFSVALAVLGSLLLGTPWAILLGLLGPFAARSYVTFRLQRTRRAFAEQIPETLDVIASALRAGHSLMGAFSVAVEAAHEPSRSEYGRALADEQLGVPLDDALRVVAQRMDSRDVIQIALVARLQREAGTNAAEVLDHVSANVRNEMELQRLVRSLTAQGRMARWIVSLLPVFLFIVLYFLNREYLEPLWQEALGKAALVLAGVLIVTGSLIIKKIVDIRA